MTFVKSVLGLPGSLRKVLRRLSLRSRLVLGVVLVTVIGLGAADAVVYVQIESYLLQQVDSQLVTTTGAMEQVLLGPATAAPGAPVGTWGMLISTSGTIVNSRCVVATFRQDCAAPRPTLPPDLLPKIQSASHAGVYFSAGTSGHSSYNYRVLAKSLNTFDSVLGPVDAVVVAIPLAAENGTLDRLILIDLGVSAVVLAMLVAIGYAVVRVGLRPLVEIEETASAIAAGDLSRRVERDDAGTELGRLGGALNVMLSRIESAFGEQKAAEARLRQFLADASHELRTPVTSIRGYAELFRRGAASRPEDLARAMQRIEDESVRMGVLVDDLLLLARLDQGRPLERARVDLSAIAVDVAADAQMLSPSRSIGVMTSGVAIVDGDEQRLRQVALNFVQNALRHTPDGTPIEVAVTVEGGRARLSVTDHGPGIEPEHLERVFERFYRADPSRTRESGGAGLGLSIVASIAEAHGGRASASSSLGVGSTFVFELPLAKEDVPAVGATGPVRDAEPADAVRGHGPVF